MWALLALVVVKVLQWYLRESNHVNGVAKKNAQQNGLVKYLSQKYECDLIPYLFSTFGSINLRICYVVTKQNR